jgi:negative regulator of flagellin synthesis FlgM
MAMINNLLPPMRGNGLPMDLVPSKATPSSGSGRHGKPVTEVDEVQLTPESARLREQLGAAGADAPMDSARIQALKQAIENGQYQVSSKRLAINILKFEGSLP